MAEGTDHPVGDAPLAEGVVGHAPEAHGGAFPPFDPTYFASQILWLSIAFVALYFMMGRVALPRIAGVIEARRDRIAGDLEKAETLKAQAESAIAAYEAALQEARTRALAIAAENRARIGEEIDALKAETQAGLALRITEAEERIAGMKETALAKVRDVAAEVTATTVEKLLGGPVAIETARRHVEAEIAARKAP